MLRNIYVFLFACLTLTANAQNNMRPVEQLINEIEPAWPLVNTWIKAAKNKVEVLTTDSVKSKEALYQVQVTTRSPMGSIVYMTGGLLIDNGWIRILGAGSPRLKRSLPEWNRGRSLKQYGEVATFLLIADDAIGGFYLLNGGKLGKDLGKVYYLSPDNLEYEPLDQTYTEFLLFCFNNDLNKFYAGKRWSNWSEDVSNLDGNNTFSFYPFLWTKEGKDINKVSRKEIPVAETYDFNLEMRSQLKKSEKSGR
jgi:hypothetical protein